MNPFSQLLSSYVNASNVNVSKMASYCEIDRSSMYKILQGTRKPGTLDLVVRISHYLNLSPEQTELLTEQYEILQIGQKTYGRRKAIYNLLCVALSPNRPRISEGFLSSYISVSGNKRGRSGRESLVIEGTDNILSACGYLVQEEIKRPDGLVQIRMQPEKRFCDLLRTICKNRHPVPGGGYTIHQIIALKGRDTSTDVVPFNLEKISTMLPLCKEVFPFELYYYHTNIHSSSITFSFLPYAVITESAVVQISEDLRYAVLHNAPETVAFFKTVYRRLLEACSPLTENCRDYRDLLVRGLHRTVGCGSVSFSTFPGLSAFMTVQLYEKYLRKDLPDRNFILRAGLDLARKDLKCVKAHALSVFVSEKGIRDFMETGRIYQYPSSLYNPLEPGDRLDVLQHYIRAMREQHISFHIIRETLTEACSRISILLDKNFADIKISDEQENLKIVTVRDPEILGAAMDFFARPYEDICYDEEKSLEILESVSADYSPSTAEVSSRGISRISSSAEKKDIS